jgi:hypothetical protein
MLGVIGKGQFVALEALGNILQMTQRCTVGTKLSTKTKGTKAESKAEEQKAVSKAEEQKAESKELPIAAAERASEKKAEETNEIASAELKKAGSAAADSKGGGDDTDRGEAKDEEQLSVKGLVTRAGGVEKVRCPLMIICQKLVF